MELNNELCFLLQELMYAVDGYPWLDNIRIEGETVRIGKTAFTIAPNIKGAQGELLNPGRIGIVTRKGNIIGEFNPDIWNKFLLIVKLITNDKATEVLYGK